MNYLNLTLVILVFIGLIYTSNRLQAARKQKLTVPDGPKDLEVCSYAWIGTIKATEQELRSHGLDRAYKTGECVYVRSDYDKQTLMISRNRKSWHSIPAQHITINE